jgi:outer membrane protein OmpA-like peptidoglycan-associated protein
MMRYARIACCLTALVALNAVSGRAQEKSRDASIARADKFFAAKNYAEALKAYQEVIVRPSDAGDQADLAYRIGKSLIESPELNDRIQSIPFMEHAMVLGLEPVPFRYYLDLGKAYMENEEAEQALVAFNKHLALFRADAKAKTEAEMYIRTASTAHKLMKQPRNVQVRRLGSSVNTEQTEYNPVVSADEAVMAFTALRPTDGRSRTAGKLAEEIMIAYNHSGAWSVPEPVTVQTDNNYGTAGISSDGQEMLVFIGDRRNGSLYLIRKETSGWSRPQALGSNINSGYLETTASLTPDGNTLYFASNRPGGHGGLDIWKSQRQTDGSWGRPVNLGPTINTRDDEDAPYIHPNQHILFFSSTGHSGMGGSDIFKSTLADGAWSRPVNMGYPVNTPANDGYFSLIADGSRGYFSSDRKGGAGGHDIYMMDMPEDFETIPLTMIKGRILDADSGKPIPTRISMIDNATGDKIDYVYHPSHETGDYLVILPPNKNYDMIIESDGFLPYTLNIDIPNQTSFYELYQKINLKTITQFDVIVGQEVEVKNAFFHSQQQRSAELRKTHEAALIQSDSIDVYELMGALMDAGDKEGVDYLVSLILMNNPIGQVDFEAADDPRMQSAKRLYYYDESDESKFEKKKVDEEIIYSLPTLYVAREAELQKEVKTSAPVKYDPSLLTREYRVYFAVNQSGLDPKYQPMLEEVLAHLSGQPGLGVEISGYASPEGERAANEKLSNERAIEVLNYLNHRGIVRRRIVARGYGASDARGMTAEESRRVDLRIVDLERPVIQ